MRIPSTSHHCLRVWGAGAASLTLVMSLALSLVRPTGLDAQSAGDWKKDWSVKCTWTHQLLLVATSELVETLFPELGFTGLPEAVANELCDDRPPSTSPAAFSRVELRAASHWLSELGFPPPIVKSAPNNPDKYLAWIDDQLFTDKSSGIVDRGAKYLPFTGEIFISPKESLAPRGSEAHELFHGVQNGAAPAAVRRMIETPDVKDLWVIEGTAEAVSLAWARKPGSLAHGGFYRRHFDVPLWSMAGASLQGVPITDPTLLTADQKKPAYATARFWLDVGRQLKAKDWVGYLPEVLPEILTGTSQQSSVEAVDVALESLFKKKGIEGGLYRAFPEFVRYVLRDPDQAADDFQFVRSVPLRMPPRDDEVTVKTVTHQVKDIAANAYKVRVRVPTGLIAGLRIEFEQDDRHLHLIVDDQRLNRFPNQANPNRVRNVFATTLSGTGRDTTFYVRVVNVARRAGQTNDVNYTLKFTTYRSRATAVVSGSEHARLEGVLFSYMNTNADPQAVARAITPALTERYADHAGLDETTEAGRQAREQIRAAVSQAQPPPDSENAAAQPRGPAQCVAIITLFNDDERAVARLIWEGGGPLLDGEHAIRGSYAHGLHDAIYGTMKQLGQEMALMDDPEALAVWGSEFQGLTIPGVEDFYRQAGAGDPFGLLGKLAQLAPLVQRREGQAPPPRPGQESFGRSYEQNAEGKLWMGKSAGEAVKAGFVFAAFSEEGAPVRVEGTFTAVPGPLISHFLRTGCDTLPEPDPEDNGDITPAPAVYPPGIGEEDTDFCTQSAETIAFCACFAYAASKTLVSLDLAQLDLTNCMCDALRAAAPESELTMTLCGRPPPPPCEGEDCPVDCVVGERTMRVLEDWHVVVVDGKPVERRIVHYEWEVLVEPRNGGKPCPPGETVTEERPIPGDPVDCRAGPVIETVLEDWHVVTTESGERVERRTVRREREVLEPARNGGKPCPPPEIVEEERPIPDDPVDCVVGERIVTVLEDWHPVVIDGQRVEQRTVRYDWEILVEPRNGGEPCPPGETVTETRPVSQRGPEADPGDPADPDQPPEDEATPGAPGEGRTGVIGPNMTLEFLEEGQADLRSDPQSVVGSASLGQVSVSSGAFALGMALDTAEVGSCDFSQGMLLFLERLASGRLLQGELRLDADAGEAEVELEFDQGRILVRADRPGSVQLSGGGPIRGDVAGGDLVLLPSQGGEFGCDGIMDFSFRLTEAP